MSWKSLTRRPRLTVGRLRAIQRVRARSLLAYLAGAGVVEQAIKLLKTALQELEAGHDLLAARVCSCVATTFKIIQRSRASAAPEAGGTLHRSRASGGQSGLRVERAQAAAEAGCTDERQSAQPGAAGVAAGVAAGGAAAGGAAGGAAGTEAAGRSHDEPGAAILLSANKQPTRNYQQQQRRKVKDTVHIIEHRFAIAMEAHEESGRGPLAILNMMADKNGPAFEPLCAPEALASMVENTTLGQMVADFGAETTLKTAINSMMTKALAMKVFTTVTEGRLARQLQWLFHLQRLLSCRIAVEDRQ